MNWLVSIFEISLEYFDFALAYLRIMNKFKPELTKKTLSLATLLDFFGDQVGCDKVFILIFDVDCLGDIIGQIIDVVGEMAGVLQDGEYFLLADQPPFGQIVGGVTELD